MNAVLALVLGLGGFAFYLHGLYPSVSVGDSGEFITAAWTLGVPHPPGFPLYSLVGHLFADVVPWGNPAYRLNLFSAAAGGASVALFYGLLRRQGLRMLLAFSCALLLLFANALVGNARASEVFALNTLFVVATLYAALCRHWSVAFLLAGLGAGNHQIILFMVPVLAFCFWNVEPAPHKGRQAAVMLASFLVGLVPYVALLVRARAGPFLNIGHPMSSDALWRVMRRADYGTLTLALGEMPVRTLGNVGLQLARLGKGLAAQSTGFMILLALVGVRLNTDAQRKNLRVLGLSFVVLGPFFFLLGNLPFDAQSNGLLARFLIAPTVPLLCCSAFGLEALYRKSRSVACGLLLVAIGWQSAHADWIGFRNDFSAYAYGRNTLRTLPPSARFIMDGGDDTFYTLAYLTQVEHRRPDLTFHDRGGVVFANPYGNDFRSLDHAAKEARRQEIERLLVAGDRPLYYSTMNQNLLPGTPMTQEGILYTPTLKKMHPPYNLWPLYDLRGLPPWDFPVQAVTGDYRTRALVPFYAYQRSVQLLNQNNLGKAWLFIRTAFYTGPDVLWLVPNVVQTAHICAYQAFNARDYQLARGIYEWIVSIQPHDTTAQRDLEITIRQSRAHP